MNFQTRVLRRCIPEDVLCDSLSNLNRPDLCILQLVNSLFRDAVDELLPAIPYLPRYERFSLYVTTEDIGTPLYGPTVSTFDLNYFIHYDVQPTRRDPDHTGIPKLFTKFAQISLLHTEGGGEPIPVLPKYLPIHDFTLVYGKLLSSEQLRPLDNLASQCAPFFTLDYQWRAKDTYRHGMRCSLEYSRHHAMRDNYRIELSGEVLEYILSRLFLAHNISLWVKDLPKTGPRSLLTLRGVRHSSVLRLVADGECHQKLSPDAVMDYVLGCDLDSEAGEFNALHGRSIYLSVNVLENGDASMPLLAEAIIQVWFCCPFISVNNFAEVHGHEEEAILPDRDLWVFKCGSRLRCFGTAVHKQESTTYRHL